MTLILEIAAGIVIGLIVFKWLSKVYRDLENKLALKRGNDLLNLMQKNFLESANALEAKNKPTFVDISQLTKEAKRGDAQAQFLLGDCYLGGNGVKQDHTQAVEWFYKAATQGNIDAQLGLATAYDGGFGVAQDYGEALKWYRMVAEKGDADAECGLGMLYYEGKGVTKDFKEANIWLRKSAEQGNTTAQSMLGCFYYDGMGVTQSFEEAYFWLTLALPANASAGSVRDMASRQLTPQQISSTQKRAATWKPAIVKK